MRLRDALFVIIIAVVLIAMWAGWRDCREQGGHYVRGLFWMGCVR